MLEVKNLKCEYIDNPIGIDTNVPRFSWQLHSNKRNVVQTRCHIQVAIDNEFKNIIWNMDTFSEKSIHIVYAGPPLQSRREYFYRVKVWDNKNNESNWSSIRTFETGLMKSSEWRANWITVKNQRENVEFKAKAPFSLSREFKLKKKVKKATIYSTCLGVYEMNLNGKKVGEDYLAPGWTDYNRVVQYQIYDVTKYLNENNKLKVTVGEGWYSGYLGWIKQKNIYGNRNAFLMQMYIYYTDGTTEMIGSDESFKEEYCNILMSDIYNGEIYDASYVGNYMLENAVILDYPKNHIVAQQNESVTVQNILTPIEIIKTPKGETVLDMGQNMAGFVQFVARGAKGEVLALTHGEVLDKDGNFYRDNIREAAAQIKYVCNGEGEEIYAPHFTFQGFRYVKLEGFKYPRLEDFKGVVLHSNMESIGIFETSNTKINQLQHNILWGQKSNFIDVPTDCPQRDERLGWTGDAQIFARTACFNMNSAKFFSKWLKDLSFNQLSNGAVPFVVPDILKGTFANGMGYTTAGWGDAAVICPWTIYMCYGDENILLEQYESMKKWINHMRSEGTSEYLWDNGMQLGDWLALDAGGGFFGATDGYLISTAFYAYSTKLFSQIAKILGRFDDYKTYSELYKGIKAAYEKKYFDEEGNITSETQTAQVISLYFDLVPSKFKNKVVEKLVQLIENKNMHLDTGFLGTPYICHVLSDNGHADVAFKLLFNRDYPSWLYQVERGATTMWEHWDSIKEDGSFWDVGMNSFNHYAYGSVGDWMYQCIGGIDMLESGYKKVKIAPKLCKELTTVKASLNTMYGSLLVAYEIIDEHITFEIEIPENTRAQITLPSVKHVDSVNNNIIQLYNEKINVVNISSNSFSEEEKDIDFEFTTICEGSLAFNVGSGIYKIKYELER